MHLELFIEAEQLPRVSGYLQDGGGCAGGTGSNQSKVIMMKQTNAHAAMVEMLELRQAMIKAGFPLCYTEGGVQYHCESCMLFYQNRQETHTKSK